MTHIVCTLPGDKSAFRYSVDPVIMEGINEVSTSQRLKKSQEFSNRKQQASIEQKREGVVGRFGERLWGKNGQTHWVGQWWREEWGMMGSRILGWFIYENASSIFKLRRT
jgi:hypothetical protein